MQLKKLIYDNFTILDRQPNQKLISYRCNHCCKSYAQHITRMANHLLKDCKSSPEFVKYEIKKQLKHKKSSGKNDILSDEDTTSELSVPRTSDRNQNITNFCDNMTKNDQLSAENLLAVAIFASGTPLSITENVHWQEFIRYLRPTFQLPSRHVISGPLLNSIHQLVQQEVNKCINDAQFVGLQCDGWSNIRNEGIVNFIITTPKPVFFKTVSIADNIQNAEFYAQEISTVISEIGVDKILSVCTDNAAVMKSAWKLVENRFNPTKFVFYGCVVHILNLLLKDIGGLPSIKSLIHSATSIVNEIKKKHLLIATFNKIQSQVPECSRISLKNPGLTRFGSTLICIDSLLLNKWTLQNLAITPTVQLYLDPLTKNIILDETFWAKLAKVYGLMKPVTEWMTTLESDTPRFSEVCTAFSKIRSSFDSELGQVTSPFSNEDKSKIYRFLESRRVMAVQPIHLAANLLEPLKKGEDLDDVETITASSFISSIAHRFGLDENEITIELTDYSLNAGFFSNDYVQRTGLNLTAVKWWGGVCKSVKLSKIAIEILSLSPTSAATERSFSTYGWIHSSKRNRLKLERAGMITYVAHNVKLLDIQALKHRQYDKNNVQNDETDEDDI